MQRIMAMSEKDFEEFLRKAIVTYADLNVKTGRWQREESLNLSRAEHKRLFPDGHKTRNNYLYNILGSNHNEIAGHIWYSINGSAAFIFDIEIYEPYRKQGYAKEAIAAAEKRMVEMGAKTVSLQVRKDNANAQNLYLQLDYETVALNMTKHFIE
jgi:ribosomal protein S18 acetylase RimI-like enzyme